MTAKVGPWSDLLAGNPWAKAADRAPFLNAKEGQDLEFSSLVLLVIESGLLTRGMTQQRINPVLASVPFCPSYN